MDYSAKEVLEHVFKKIAETAPKTIIFKETVRLVYDHDDNGHSCYANFNSACIVKYNSENFLIAYANIDGMDWICGFKDATIVAVKFDEEPNWVHTYRKMYNLCCTDKPIDSYIEEKLGGNPKDPEIKAKLLIEQCLASGKAVIQSSYVHETIYTPYRALLRPINEHIGQDSIAGDMCHVTNDIIKFNDTLVDRLADNIVYYVDMITN